MTTCSTVCQIDYEDMLDAHIASGVDITEAVSGETGLSNYILKKKPVEGIDSNPPGKTHYQCGRRREIEESPVYVWKI
nr:hypothetical protein [Planococcus glaciei]